MQMQGLVAPAGHGYRITTPVGPGYPPPNPALTTVTVYTDPTAAVTGSYNGVTASVVATQGTYDFIKNKSNTNTLITVQILFDKNNAVSQISAW